MLRGRVQYFRLIHCVDGVHMVHMSLAAVHAGQTHLIRTDVCNVQLLVYRYLFDNSKTTKDWEFKRSFRRPSAGMFKIMFAWYVQNKNY